MRGQGPNASREMQMRRLLAFAVVLIAAAVAPAQPLADRLPADTIVYLGFTGTQNVPGFAGTHAEALLQQSNLPEIFRQVIPQAIAKAKQKQPGDAEQMQAAYEIASLVARNPTAVFFAGLRMPEQGGEPLPKLGIVCRVGGEAEALRLKIANKIREGDADSPVRVIADGQDLAIVIGYDDDQSPLVAGGAGGLAASPSFVAARKQVHPDPAGCFFIDVEKLFELIDGIVAQEAPPEAGAMYQKVMDASGLRGLKHAMVTGGFDGKDWMSQSYLAAPAPRSGLLKLMDGPPVTDELLRAIPVDADLAVAGSFDAGKLIAELREIAGKIDPQYQKFFDQGLGAAQMAIGTPLQAGVLDPLGTHWAAYTSANVSGGGLPGLVLINRTDDPEKAKRGLMAVSIFANNSAATALKGKEITVQGRQFKSGDLAINYVAAPLVTPSWAVSGNYAVFALYPQTIIDANKQLVAGGKSILDHPGYQAMRQRLGQKDVSGVYFADLPKTAPQTYGGLLVVSRLVGFADLFGIQTPPVVIPPYSVLAEHLGPAGGVSWVDDAGVHGKVVQPFPGAGVFQGSAGAGPAIVGQAALLTSIALPSLTRARETANRVKCATNMRQIGLGAMLYANENQGKFPEDLGTILKTQDIAPEVFVCPSDDMSGVQMEELRRRQGDERSDWLTENSHYVWLGAGKTTREGAEVVLMYERPENHEFDGINVLFADGHVEFMLRDQAERAIPDIQFPPRRR